MQVVGWLKGIDFDYMESSYRCRIRRNVPIRGAKNHFIQNPAKAISNQIWYLHSSLSQAWQDLYLFSYKLETYIPSACYYEHAPSRKIRWLGTHDSSHIGGSHEPLLELLLCLWSFRQLNDSWTYKLGCGFSLPCSVGPAEPGLSRENPFSSLSAYQRIELKSTVTTDWISLSLEKERLYGKRRIENPPSSNSKEIDKSAVATYRWPHLRRKAWQCLPKSHV